MTENRQTKNKKNEIDMTTGALLPKILIFLVPLIASSTLQLLFNAADVVVVGRYAGANALAAVGANSALINLATNIFIGLSVGTNVVAAMYYGAGKYNELRETISTSVVVGLIGGVFLIVVGLLFAGPMLILMGTPAEVEPLAELYLKIYFLGMPAMLLYNFGAAVLRAAGDTKRPLFYLLYAGVINIVLNLFLVIVCKMGVAGVAIATVVSQIVSAVLVLLCLINNEGDMSLDVKKLSINRRRMREIVAVGIPAGIQGMLFSFSNVLIQSSVNSFGAIAVAGNTAASNVEGFVYMAMNASSQASVSFTGQNYGAHKRDRILKVLGYCCLTTTLTSIIIGYPAFWGARGILSLYSSDSAVIEFGVRRLSIILTTYFLCGLMEIPVGVMRGMGHGVAPVIISLLGACGLRIVWIFTVFQINRTPEVLYISYPVTWIVTFVVQMIALAVVWKKESKRYKQ